MSVGRLWSWGSKMASGKVGECGCRGTHEMPAIELLFILLWLKVEWKRDFALSGEAAGRYAW